LTLVQVFDPKVPIVANGEIVDKRMTTIRSILVYPAMVLLNELPTTSRLTSSDCLLVVFPLGAFVLEETILLFDSIVHHLSHIVFSYA
jgi:hypothetical protein